MRVGLLDIGAAGALLAALMLPSPSRPVKAVYAKETASLAMPIATAQADVARNPGDGNAVKRLADLLSRAHQSDWAVRIAADASRTESPERWRSLVAVSQTHVDRLEIAPAYLWATKALEACEATGADCPPYEHDRLDLYVTNLKVGLDSGIDPRRNPHAFENAVQKASPIVHIHPNP
jgi:hypothetical protein